MTFYKVFISYISHTYSAFGITKQREGNCEVERRRYQNGLDDCCLSLKALIEVRFTLPLTSTYHIQNSRLMSMVFLPNNPSYLMI